MNPTSLAKAKELLADCRNVTFLNDFGEKMTQQYEDYFDLTLSLSALEHVKYIEEFLQPAFRSQSLEEGSSTATIPDTRCIRTCVRRPRSFYVTNFLG